MSSRSNSSVTGLRPRYRSPSGSSGRRSQVPNASIRCRRPRAVMFSSTAKLRGGGLVSNRSHQRFQNFGRSKSASRANVSPVGVQRLHARDPEHAHLPLHAPDQVPGVDFHDQRVRLDAVVAMLAVAALVTDIDAGVLPEQRAQLIQERRSVARAEPGLRIEQQPAARVLRTQLMNRGHGRCQLVERRVSRHRQLAHAHRCRTRDERERLRLARRQAGQIGRVTLDEANAAAAPCLAVHRHAHGGQRVDVAKDRADRHLETLRQLARRERVAALQSHEDGNEPLRAHAISASLLP